MDPFASQRIDEDQILVTDASGSPVASSLLVTADLAGGSAGRIGTLKVNLGATAAPGGSDGFLSGYRVGSIWRWGSRWWLCYGDALWREVADAAALVALANAVDTLESRWVYTAAPLIGGGNIGAGDVVLSMSKAGMSGSGWLSQADWQSFNSRAPGEDFLYGYRASSESPSVTLTGSAGYVTFAFNADNSSAGSISGTNGISLNQGSGSWLLLYQVSGWITGATTGEMTASVADSGVGYARNTQSQSRWYNNGGVATNWTMSGMRYIHQSDLASAARIYRLRLDYVSGMAPAVACAQFMAIRQSGG